jgi:hypothetical protein
MINVILWVPFFSRGQRGTVALWDDLAHPMLLHPQPKTTRVLAGDAAAS